MEEIAVFSVLEVTRHIRQVLESSIESLYVMGEISGFVHHSSGHMYFNLKDENATLRCTFFRNANYRLDFKPTEGMQVVCYGRITVFEKGGTYNLNVSSITQAGLGLMQQKIELLKKKLLQEGLFDPKHKKALPKYPETIGIVTSPTGAALQDIKNVIMRRFPVQMVVYPALVQGAEAPEQLIKGIRYFNDTKSVELIILARGGGSPEDLFCFNDEALVRAVFASRLPVISAVGHEIDYTLVDFVADLRAPTPSAAAELAVPAKEDLKNYLLSLQRRMQPVVDRKRAELAREISALQLELSKYHPERLWQSLQQRFDMATLSLGNTAGKLESKRMELHQAENNSLGKILQLLTAKTTRSELQQQHLAMKLQEGVASRLERQKMRLDAISELLEQLSPSKMRDKGWLLAEKQGKILKSVHDLNVDDYFTLHFADGKATNKVLSIERDK